MKPPRRPLRAALAIAAALAASACTDLATTASEPGMRAVDGTYDLVSINQQPLPYSTMSDGSGARITSGRLTLEQTSTYQQVLGFTGPNSQWVSPTYGTYAVGGARVVFRVSTGPTFEGTVHPDGRLEYVVPGNYGPLVFVFRRT